SAITTTTYSSNAGGINPPVTGTKRLGELQKEVDGIPAKAKELSLKGDVKSGIFIDAKLDVNVPTEVPGLSITIKLDGKYERSGGGDQELELKQSTGVEFGFRDFFSVSAERFQYLKLEGEELGKAFIDAVKQVTRWILIATGAEQKLYKLANWKRLSRGQQILILISDFGYGPFASIVQAPELLATLVPPQQIQDLVNKYNGFFKNNPLVGFEVGIGYAVSAEAK